MHYSYLLWTGLILFSTKALGLIVRRFGLPEVVGCLLAGILIGPSVLNMVSMSGDNGVFLQFSAEFGVIFLMFDAGLTTNLRQLKKNALASFVIALMGVCVPLVGGLFTYSLYFHKSFADYNAFLESLFVGVVLTATSVSITVSTLKELGKLNGDVGTTILGAAVIDDVLGIIVLTIVSSLKGSADELITIGIKIVLYMLMVLVLLFLCRKMEPFISKAVGMRRSALFAFAFAFALSYISEEFFGITDITGAYFAGLMLSDSAIEPYISTRVSNVTNMFFGAIFYACIGIKVTVGGMSIGVWCFALVLTLVAMVTKLLGCGMGALMNRFKAREALQIGVGMISRGEVALIVAEKGRQLGMLSANMFAPIVLMVIATTLVTPVLLKMVFAGEAGAAH